MPIVQVSLGDTLNTKPKFIEVPEREKDVLVLLGTEKLTVPEIARKQTGDGKMSNPSIYSMLYRMQEKGFVTCEEKFVAITGTDLKRTLWSTVFSKLEEITTIKNLK